MKDSIVITTPDGNFNAYIARPSSLPAAAIVVLHEIFGINADMRDRCDELAGLGYIALCPDLFWRLEPGVELSDQSEAEWKKGFALYTAFDVDKGISDIAAVLGTATSLPGSNSKTGLTGYCLGGLLTVLATARLAPHAAVAYYPGGAEKHVPELQRLTSPMLLHLADEDEYIPREAQLQIVTAVHGHPNVEVHRYAGCRHAFARHRGIHFDAAAAATADARTGAFFQRHLAT